MKQESSQEMLKSLQEGFTAAAGETDGRKWAHYVEYGEGGPESDVQLLIWDTLSIHSIVFDTSNAMAIRGASVILDSIDSTLRLEKKGSPNPLNLKKEQVVYAGAGGGMAVVSTEQASKAPARLRRFFAENALSAICAVESVKLEADKKTFKQVFAEARRKLERARALTGLDSEPAVPPFVQRCQVCGKRAAGKENRRNRGRRLECAVCIPCLEIGKTVAKREAEDYEHIASDGWIALVYIDGNRFGELFSQVRSHLEYQLLSRSITVIFNAAVKIAEKEQNVQLDESKASGNIKRYQRPIFAGDDLTAILPADRALKFACSFLKAVEEGIDARSELDSKLKQILSRAESPVAAAAGVAIGKVTYPVRHLVQEAEDLMDRAKALVYSKGGPRSALDFAVVRDGSPRAESEKAKRLEEEPPPLLLSGRPFSLGEMGTFASRLETFRASGLGKSQLYQLGRFAEAGPAQLRNHVLFQIGRDKRWQELLCALASDDRKPGMDADRDFKAIVPHWPLGEAKKKHPVLDIADMLAVWGYWLREEAGDEAV